MAKLRGRRCTICSHPARAEIDAHGGTLVRTSRAYGLSAPALQRHRKHAALRPAPPTHVSAGPSRVVGVVLPDFAAPAAVPPLSTAVAPLATVARDPPASTASGTDRKAAGNGDDDASTPGPVDARGLALETLGTLRTALRKAPPEDVSKLANSITATAKFLARLEGDLDLTPVMILRSKAWRDMMGRIEVALTPYPEAAGALSRAFAEFRG